MHAIYELKEKLMKELEEYGSQEMTAGALQVVDALAHTIKNLCKIIESAEDEEGGSSYYMGGSSYRGGSSRAGVESMQSRARGRGRSARRDSMGRYSSERGSSRYEGGSSRYDGGGSSYEDGMEQMVESIRGMMQELPQEVQRDAQRFVKKLEEQM